LFLGGGALNAFAADHGNSGGHGNHDSGKVEHQQSPPSSGAPAHRNEDSNGHSQGNGSSPNKSHADESSATTSVTTNHDNGDDNEAKNNNSNDDDNNNNNNNNDNDVDEPEKVTEEVRPGKGCGDVNHVHERHDECKNADGDNVDE
jgi:hypothetical protein